MADDSEPGPFLVKSGNKQAVLEIVNSSNAQYHDVASMLGSTGASMFFVLKPVGREKNNARVIVIWPIHTLSSTLTHDFYSIQESAEQGLLRQIQFINMRYPVAKLTGLVLADAFLEDEPYFNAGSNTHLARLAATPELWPKNIEILKLLLEDLFEELLGK